MDMKILDILSKCEALEHYDKFMGLTEAQLLSMSVKQIKRRLAELFPEGQAQQNLISTFMTELLKEEVPGPKIKVEIKQEPDEQLIDPISSPAPPPGNDQIIQNIEMGQQTQENEGMTEDSSDCASTIVDEKNLDQDINTQQILNQGPNEEEDDDGISVLYENIPVKILCEKNPGTEAAPSIVLDLEDDDEEDEVVDNSTTSNQTQPTPSTSAETIPRGRKRAHVATNPMEIAYLPSNTIQDRRDDPVLIRVANQSNLAKYGWNDWTRFYTLLRPRIDTVCLEDWTWKPLNAKCPLNLNFLLNEGLPGLRELVILNNNIRPGRGYVTPSAAYPRLKLNNLTVLKIDQDFLLNYDAQLMAIIAGAEGSLEQIEVIYGGEFVLLRFLCILESFQGTELATLKSLSIKKWDGSCHALVPSELDCLAKIKAKGLERLVLGFGLTPDAPPSLAAMLDNFKGSLKVLEIYGGFLTTEENEPRIIIHFPVMQNLERMEIGANCLQTLVLESVDERPEKKKRYLPLSLNIQEEQDIRNQANVRVILEDPEFFSVTLKFHVLPKLETLILGPLYELDQDFRFSIMPSLETFRVRSPWNRYVKDEQRRNSFPNVKQITLPDLLQDYTFVANLPSYFPNLEKCQMTYPTIKVVRSFAKVMQNVESFQCLVMWVDFEFASSLNSCIFEKPWTVPPSAEEVSQIQALKECPFWEEYVEVNNIQLPNHEEREEDENAFAGLHALASKLKTLVITVNPKTLRLPRGKCHFNDEKCEFSNTLIGFEENKYPISDEARTKLGKCGTLRHYSRSRLPSCTVWANSRGTMTKIDPSKQEG